VGHRLGARIVDRLRRRDGERSDAGPCLCTVLRVSNYTKVNLLELEDTVGDRAPELEGRFGRTALESRDVGVSHWRYAPGFRSGTAHRHREQEEVYVVVAGSGRALLDGEVVDLTRWDTVRVAPEVVRAFESGRDGLEVIAVGGPKPEGGDGEPASADWPD
jgi:mannose-6-phosphate isomerase-like protein (cupin superfamily)